MANDITLMQRQVQFGETEWWYHLTDDGAVVGPFSSPEIAFMAAEMDIDSRRPRKWGWLTAAAVTPWLAIGAYLWWA